MYSREAVIVVKQERSADFALMVISSRSKAVYDVITVSSDFYSVLK